MNHMIHRSQNSVPLGALARDKHVLARVKSSSVCADEDLNHLVTSAQFYDLTAKYLPHSIGLSALFLDTAHCKSTLASV